MLIVDHVTGSNVVEGKCVAFSVAKILKNNNLLYVKIWFYSYPESFRIRKFQQMVSIIKIRDVNRPSSA